jgi:hypothetical protein
MAGMKGIKNAEQWCFSIGKADERFAGNGVSATEGKNGRLLCFSNGEGERNKCWTELFRK